MLGTDIHPLQNDLGECLRIQDTFWRKCNNILWKAVEGQADQTNFKWVRLDPRDHRDHQVLEVSPVRKDLEGLRDYKVMWVLLAHKGILQQLAGGGDRVQLQLILLLQLLVLNSHRHNPIQASNKADCCRPKEQALFLHLQENTIRMEIKKDSMAVFCID